jgi:hypothetical protein
MRGLLGLVVAGLMAGSILPAQAENWCGFHQKPNARVHCGFSSLAECMHALGANDKDKNKDVVCKPDPSSARARSKLGQG